MAGAIYGLASHAQLPEDKKLDLTYKPVVLYACMRSVQKSARHLREKYWDGKWPYD